MIKKWGLSIVFSFIIWVGAISFFILFSHQLQLDVSQSSFVFPFLVLEFGTLILLTIASFIYQKLDRSPFAGVKLAILGPAIGLFYDTFVLWNYTKFFPTLNEIEVIGFSTWMAFAYVLFLLTPLFVTRKRIEQFLQKNRGISYGS